MCLVGPRTFVILSWMCKKQTAISHSSVEAQVISLDIGLRMDGDPSFTRVGPGVGRTYRSSEGSQASPVEKLCLDSGDELFHSELFKSNGEVT